jgi:hypothetical protein
VIERVPPAQPLETGRERGRVTHQDDDFDLEVPREPVAREGRDRIFDDEAAAPEWGNPVLQLVLEKDLSGPPFEDFVEGF